MAKRTSNQKPSATGVENAEPVGIVISSGTRDTDAPKFTAYVWGPIPEGELEEALVAVA